MDSYKIFQNIFRDWSFSEKSSCPMGNLWVLYCAQNLRKRHIYWSNSPGMSLDTIELWHYLWMERPLMSHLDCIYSYSVGNSYQKVYPNLLILQSIIRNITYNIIRANVWYRSGLQNSRKISPSQVFFVTILEKNDCINSSPPSAAYMCQWIGSALVQIMACRLIGDKPLSKPMLGYCQLDP